MNIFADIHPTTKFNLRGNFFVFFRKTENAINPGQNAQSWNYRANLTMSYNFTDDFAGECLGNITSPRNELQGKYPSFSIAMFGFQRQIWKKKGSLALTTINIFSKYINQATNLYGEGCTTSSTRQVPFRSMGIIFTRKFGKMGV